MGTTGTTGTIGTTGLTMVASDLDRTLIYSPSALMLADTDVTVQRLLCVEVYEGKPLSFVTERAGRLIAALGDAGVLVPVTTRTVAQYRRISLPGPVPRFALTTNGGRLLVDGVEDADFTRATAEHLAASGAPAEEMLAELTRAAERVAGGRRFVEKVRDASGLFCYAVVERKHVPPTWVEDLTGFAAERAWTVSVQGRKVYLVPAALSKAAAARRVAELMGADRMVAAGDSLLDGPLLEAADAAIRPAHGELADTGFTRDHLDVTAARGVVAGEQIVDWMAAAALTG